MTSLFSVLLKSDQSFKSMSESAIWAILRRTWGHDEDQNAKMQRNLASKKIRAIELVGADACAKPLLLKHSTVLRAAGTLRNAKSIQKTISLPRNESQIDRKNRFLSEKKIRAMGLIGIITGVQQLPLKRNRFVRAVGCSTITNFCTTIRFDIAWKPATFLSNVWSRCWSIPNYRMPMKISEVAPNMIFHCQKLSVLHFGLRFDSWLRFSDLKLLILFKKTYMIDEKT